MEIAEDIAKVRTFSSELAELEGRSSTQRHRGGG